MDSSLLAAMIAQVPQGELYFNPLKLIAITIFFIGWVAFAQWADKDAVRVNTFRQVWSMLSLVVGLLGLGLLVLIPNFLAALAAYAVIVGAFMLAYVIHRNNLVIEDDRVCTPAHFRRLMTEGFRGGEKGDKKKDVQEKVRITDHQREIVTVPEDAVEREVFAVVQDLLFDALLRRASRLEVVPAGQAMRFRTVIDGVTQNGESVERADGERVLAFFKGVAGLRLDERRKPQKGQIMASIGPSKYDLVVRTTGSSQGEAASIRVLGDERGYKAPDLGFSDEQLETLRELMDESGGLILISAPAGQGLTTTVYGLTRTNDAFLQNIQTLEYERELELDNITQTVFNAKGEQSFADQLLRLVRADPDVLVLPQVKDKPAAVVAAQAAAGRSTLYVGLVANDPLDTIRRWLGMVGDAELVAKGLRAVIHQRLIRKLCETCRAPYKPDAAMLKKINAPKDAVLYRPPEQVLDKNGNPVICQNCHGLGYVGRTGVYTILKVDDAMRKTIATAKSLSELKAAIAKTGGMSLQQAALQKTFDGTTSVDEVRRATRPPEPPKASK